jgi:hypothetical protein
MRYLIYITIFGIFLSSCVESHSKILNYQKSWIYIELEVKTKEDTNDYHYFGQVNQRFLDNLSYDDNYNRLFTLTNIRYLDDDDVLKLYEDNSDKGTIIFRTQDIVKIEILKIDPLLDKTYKSFSDSTKTKN